jgi:hypothetical protein
MPSPEAIAFGMETSQAISLRSIAQRVKYSDFIVANGNAALGTMTLSTRLPAYSFPIGCKVQTTKAFVGTSTATMSVGLADQVTPTGVTDNTTGVIDINIISGNTTVDIATVGKTYTKYATFSDADLTTQDDGQYVAGGSVTATKQSENYIMLTITDSSAFTAFTAGEAVVTVYYFSTIENGGNAPMVP